MSVMYNIRPLLLTAAALLHVLVGPLQAKDAKSAVAATQTFDDRELDASDGNPTSSDDRNYRRNRAGPPLQLIE